MGLIVIIDLLSVRYTYDLSSGRSGNKGECDWYSLAITTLYVFVTIMSPGLNDYFQKLPSSNFPGHRGQSGITKDVEAKEKPGKYYELPNGGRSKAATSTSKTTASGYGFSTGWKYSGGAQGSMSGH